MRHTPRSLAFGVLCAAAFVATVAIAEDSRFDPHHLVSPPLRALHVAQPERLALPNGTVVFLLEDHTFPVVSGTAYFPSSPSLIGDDRVGLAGLTGEVMRSGGSAAHTGDALDDRLVSPTQNLGGRRCQRGTRCVQVEPDVPINDDAFARQPAVTGQLGPAHLGVGSADRRQFSARQSPAGPGQDEPASADAG